MKAMILAAGKGTRVRPITYDLPKPMIPLVRKPVMESIVEHLKTHGVSEIVVNTSHLAPVLQDYFRDGERFGVQMAFSFEGSLVDGRIEGKALGSAGGVKRVQEFSGFFDETFVVLCGDALIDVDLTAVYEFHKSRGAVATIVLKDVPREDVSKYGVVQTDNDGRILAFQEKPAVEDALSSTINTGIYLFEPEVIDYIPSNIEYDIGGELFPTLVELGVPFYGIATPFQWIDIGSVPDLWSATRTVLRGEVNGYALPGREVAPGVRLSANVSIDLANVNIEGPVFIGPSAEIGNGVTIKGPTVIGANCVVEPGAVLSECIIGDYVRISKVAALREQIVFGGRCISPFGQSIDIDETQIGWLVDDARKSQNLDPWQQLLYEVAETLPNQP